MGWGILSMNTAEWIRSGRKHLGHSREWFAEILDCSVTTLKAWEDGTRAPSVRYMKLLALQLGIPSDLEYRRGRVGIHEIPGTDSKLVLVEQDNEPLKQQALT